MFNIQSFADHELLLFYCPLFVPSLSNVVFFNSLHVTTQLYILLCNPYSVSVFLESTLYYSWFFSFMWLRHFIWNMSNNIFWTCCSAGSVILDSPALPVSDGGAVTLSCKDKTTTRHLSAVFYKDDVQKESSCTGELIIDNANKSHEGLYKCSLPGARESPGSWLAVRGKTTHCFRLKSSAPKQHSCHWCLYVSVKITEIEVNVLKCIDINLLV